MSHSIFVVATIFVIGLAGSTTGCVHRGNQLAFGQEVPVPSGLDSAQKEAWAAEQARSCPGRLMRFWDRTMFAVMCEDSTKARRPPESPAAELRR